MSNYNCREFVAHYARARAREVSGAVSISSAITAFSAMGPCVDGKVDKNASARQMAYDKAGFGQCANRKRHPQCLLLQLGYSRQRHVSVHRLSSLRAGQHGRRCATSEASDRDCMWE